MYRTPIYIIEHMNFWPPPQLEQVEAFQFSFTACMTRFFFLNYTKCCNFILSVYRTLASPAPHEYKVYDYTTLDRSWLL